MMDRAQIGIIYGGGLEELCPEGTDLRIGTPYGPSPIIRLASVGDVDTAFLIRRGNRQGQPPHKINYRANLWGLHELGVGRIIGIDIAQKLGKLSKKRTLAIPNDLIDLAGSRNLTFYDEIPVVQINLGSPFCPEIRSTLLNSSQKVGIKPYEKSTYVCVSGPRSRTPAEIKALKVLGGDVVGMTLAPEVFLARELGMCYAAVTVLFDAFLRDRDSPSTIQPIETARNSSKMLRELVITTIREMPVRRKCLCSRTLEGTVV